MNNCREELKTKAQIARAARDAEICKEYKEIRETQPLVTRNRILVALAEKYGLVTMSVKLILAKNNCYN